MGDSYRGTIWKDVAKEVMVFMKQSSDHISGLTSATLTITASKAGGAFASITPTVTERGNGWYALSLTTGHTDTEGALALRITATSGDDENVAFEVSTLLESIPGADTIATAVLTGTPLSSVYDSLDEAIVLFGEMFHRTETDIFSTGFIQAASIGWVGTDADLVDQSGNSKIIFYQKTLDGKVDDKLFEWDPVNGWVITSLTPVWNGKLWIEVPAITANAYITLYYQPVAYTGLPPELRVNLTENSLGYSGWVDAQGNIRPDGGKVDAIEPTLAGQVWDEMIADHAEVGSTAELLSAVKTAIDLTNTNLGTPGGMEASETTFAEIVNTLHGRICETAYLSNQAFFSQYLSIKGWNLWDGNPINSVTFSGAITSQGGEPTTDGYRIVAAYAATVQYPNGKTFLSENEIELGKFTESGWVPETIPIETYDFSEARGAILEIYLYGASATAGNLTINFNSVVGASPQEIVIPLPVADAWAQSTNAFYRAYVEKTGRWSAETQLIPADQGGGGNADLLAKLVAGTTNIGCEGWDGSQTTPLAVAFTGTLGGGVTLTFTAKDTIGEANDQVLGTWDGSTFTKNGGWTGTCAAGTYLHLATDGQVNAGTMTLTAATSKFAGGLDVAFDVPDITAGGYYVTRDGNLSYDEGGAPAVVTISADITGDVWDALLADHTVGGSFGKRVSELARESSLYSQLTTGVVLTRVASGNDLSIYQGNAKRIVFNLGPEWNLASRKVYLCVKEDKQAGNETAIINRTCTITDEDDGVCEITTTAAETATAGNYYYEVQVRKLDESDPETAIVGAFNITENVRR